MSQKLPFMIVAVCAILGGAGAGFGGAFAFSEKKTPEPEAQPAIVLEQLPLATFAINLKGSNGARLLAMDVTIKGTPESVAMCKKNEVLIRDGLISTVSEYTQTELEGTEGKYTLKKELRRLIDANIAPEKIDDLFLTHFVIQ